MPARAKNLSSKPAAQDERQGRTAKKPPRQIRPAHPDPVMHRIVHAGAGKRDVIAVKRQLRHEHQQHSEQQRDADEQFNPFFESSPVFRDMTAA